MAAPPPELMSSVTYRTHVTSWLSGVLGSGCPQWAGADPAMRQQQQHPSSHHGFATDLQQDPSVPQFSLSPFVSCPNRLNSSGQGLSQSRWLSTMLSLLYKQKNPSPFSSSGRVVLMKHWLLIVQLNETESGELWQIISSSTSTLRYWTHKKEHSMWKSI